MSKKRQSKYPPYPSSNWDYGLKMAAQTQLRRPNKVICLYCREQAVDMDSLIHKHKEDCPAKDHR